MTTETSAPNPPITGLNTTLAVTTTAIGVVLMALFGGLVIPYGRFVLASLYGIVETVVLQPFGIALFPIVTFLLINVCFLATTLAAGRRVGAILAHRAVDRRLGSHRVASILPWIAGVAGASAFAASVPFSVDDTASLPIKVAYVTAGYLLYLPVLLVGPARGVSRYLRSHPYCPRCWAWMQRETSAGDFALTDAPQIRVALAMNDFPALHDLPIAQSDALSIQWWTCPTCSSTAYFECLPTGSSGPLVSKHIAGRPVQELRTLVAHRAKLSSAAPSGPTPPQPTA